MVSPPPLGAPAALSVGPAPGAFAHDACCCHGGPLRSFPVGQGQNRRLRRLDVIQGVDGLRQIHADAGSARHHHELVPRPRLLPGHGQNVGKSRLRFDRRRRDHGCRVGQIAAGILADVGALGFAQHPARVSVEFPDDGLEPGIGNALPALGVGNAGLANAQDLGQFDLSPGPGDRVDAGHRSFEVHDHLLRRWGRLSTDPTFACPARPGLSVTAFVRSGLVRGCSRSTSRDVGQGLS